MLKKNQKKFLKGLANPLSPVVIIGKDGLKENVIEAVDDYLDHHELIKISVLKTCDILVEELILDIIANTHSELVSQIGRKFVLYRKNPKETIIVLPK